MSSNVPFVLGAPKYDQDTFSGRFRHFIDVIDPRTLLVSEKKLKESIELLEQYKLGNVDSTTSSTDLWNAQKITQAMIHPDTGKKIPMPFRMSGYVPFGCPIVVGLLLPNQTLLTTAFWQWLNQSHNACVNYCNRNATQKSTVQDFVVGYTGACTSAVGIALGMNVVLNRLDRLTPVTRNLMQRFIPFPAVAAANVCNVVLMRRKEMDTGVEVVDSCGRAVGVSQVAARKAIAETALTRVCLSAPILLLPPIALSFIQKTKWYRKYPRASIPVQASLATLAFGLALPVAIALFPQKSQVATNKLEMEIQSNTTETVLFYNKGL